MDDARELSMVRASCATSASTMDPAALSVPHHPASNGISEWTIGVLASAERAMLSPASSVGMEEPASARARTLEMRYISRLKELFCRQWTRLLSTRSVHARCMPHIRGTTGGGDYSGGK